MFLSHIVKYDYQTYNQTAKRNVTTQQTCLYHVLNIRYQRTYKLEHEDNKLGRFFIPQSKIWLPTAFYCKRISIWVCPRCHANKEAEFKIARNIIFGFGNKVRKLNVRNHFWGQRSKLYVSFVLCFSKVTYHLRSRHIEVSLKTISNFVTTFIEFCDFEFCHLTVFFRVTFLFDFLVLFF